jgi:uncharacterized RDD family membrane protein YckC
MSERPSDSSGMTPGDPLHPGNGEPPRPEAPEAPTAPVPSAPPPSTSPGGGLWSSPQSPAPTQPSPPPTSPGYYGPASPPPPGAGGAVPASRPSGFSGQLVLAGWWRRVGAFLIDQLLIGVIALIPLSLLGIGILASNDGDDTGVVALVLALIVSLLVWAVVALLYAPLMMSKTNGKTLGRMATGIRVVRASGESMTFGVAAIREIVLKGLVVGIASAVIPLVPWLIDILWPLWDEENRALHDFPVNTRTILD